MLRSPARKPREPSPAKKRVETPPMTKGNMQVRVVSLAVLIAVVFAILGARLWYLQVLTGEEYNVMAQNTGTMTVKDPAQRGVIYDRDGEILANNKPGLNVTAVPNEISQDADRTGPDVDAGRQKVRELAEVVGADAEAVVGRYDAAWQTGAQHSPILVKENAGRDAVTYVSERTAEFKGVTVNDDWVRSYPKGNLASHVIGYTGAVTPDELNLDAYKDLSEERDAIVGKSGVEVSYEGILRGDAGWQKYDVDVLGRIVPEGARLNSMSEFVDENGEPMDANPMEELPDNVKDPEPGNNLTLTLDSDLQRVVETELDAALDRTRAEGYEGRGGAVVAMNPENGEVLALASRPDFDPQLFVGGISGDQELREYQYLASERSRDPFTNRAIVGGQPGASTFKVFTGLAGMAAGVIDSYTTVTDTGACFTPSSVSVSPCYQSWRQNSPNYAYLGDHGTQNFSEAIADSNDKFFYQVADWIWNQTSDKDWMPNYYERWGFGKLTGIDISGETEGRLPTEAGERELHKALHGSAEGAYWSVGDWINLSIGQGDLLVSPIQMAQAYSALYNGGTLVTPHVGKDIRDQSGRVVEEISPEPAGRVGTDQYQIDTVVEGFRGVTAKKGTAETIFEGSEIDTIGKSGTGELPTGDFVNWFAGWTENQDEPLVVVTMIEGGGAFQTGSEMTAGPVVRHVLEAYYGVEQSPEDPHPTGTEPIDPVDRVTTRQTAAPAE